MVSGGEKRNTGLESSGGSDASVLIALFSFAFFVFVSSFDFSSVKGVLRMCALEFASKTIAPEVDSGVCCRAGAAVRFVSSNLTFGAALVGILVMTLVLAASEFRFWRKFGCVP